MANGDGILNTLCSLKLRAYLRKGLQWRQATAWRNACWARRLQSHAQTPQPYRQRQRQACRHGKPVQFPQNTGGVLGFVETDAPKKNRNLKGLIGFCKTSIA